MPDRTIWLLRWLLMALLAIGGAALFASPAAAHAHHHAAVTDAAPPPQPCEASACTPVTLPDCCLTVTCAPLAALPGAPRADRDGAAPTRIRFAAATVAPAHGHLPATPQPPPRFPG